MDRTTTRVLLIVIMFAVSFAAHAQQPPAPQNPTIQQPSQGQNPTFDDSIEAGDDEAGKPKKNILGWNEYDGKLFSLRFGVGFLYEYDAYAQDAVSKQQIEMHPGPKLRDLRFLFGGSLKFDRPTTWSMGIMWDQTQKKLLFRQTQIMVAVPELAGFIVIGRTKEGFSLNKVMVGYAGWTMERAPISDSTIPILADGIKWLGYLPKQKLLWNLGSYWDAVSKGQTFSTYDHQIVGRIAWLPVMSQDTGKLLHIGISLRDGKVNDGALQNRSRPESFQAPFFVDTGKFPAKSTRMGGAEIYYRPGPLLMGSEYFIQDVNAPERDDPFFHGGDAFVSWIATGETRVYNLRGGYFDQISPARPVFEGGPGAWEFVARFSYVDLDSGPVRGGRFWRFTPLVNWYMSDNVRLEFQYGHGTLDRFDSVGNTQFFQTRIQLQF